MSIKTPCIAWILTSDFIKLRVSNAIHVTGCKTSLLWASKMRNMYRVSCKRRTLFCNNTNCFCNDVLFTWWNLHQGMWPIQQKWYMHHLEFCRFFKLQYKRPDSWQWCLFKAQFFFRRRRNRSNVDTTNAKIRQEKLKTKDIQNGGGNGEGIGCIKGVLLEMCHSLNLSEDIHTANIRYWVGRGIMGLGNAYLNGVLLNRSNTWFFKNLPYKQMNDLQRSQSKV